MFAEKGGIDMEKLWIADEAAAVMDALSRAGIRSWIVGGCVRDILRGKTPHDWDIAAAAAPQEMETALSAFRLLETGIRHGTVTALVNGSPVEVTACRGEGEYRDMRHPESVTFHCSLEEDLARRDFTMNALAYRPSDGLIDLYDGVRDIETGVIRCIRRPEDRFREDALRILRALRFSAQLGYRIEEETGAAIHALAGNLRVISAERCAAEFCKLILGAHAAEVLQEYGDVIAVILPVIAPMRGFYHREEHGGDLWRHSVVPLAFAPVNLAVRLALVLRDCAKPVTQLCGDDYPGHAERGAELVREALRRLKLPSALIGRTAELVRFHSALPDANRSAILRALNVLGEETLLELMDMREADRLSHGEDTADIARLREKTKELTACGACWQLSQLAVSGDDVKALGYSGREIGQTLQRLLDAVMDGRCENTHAALEAWLSTMN